MSNSVLSALQTELAELEDRKREVERKISAEKRKEQDQAKHAILELMRENGLTANDLRVKSGSMKGRTVAPQYRGPNGETWTGRGRAPKWIDGNPDAFRIQKSEEPAAA